MGSLEQGGRWGAPSGQGCSPSSHANLSRGQGRQFSHDGAMGTGRCVLVGHSWLCGRNGKRVHESMDGLNGVAVVANVLVQSAPCPRCQQSSQGQHSPLHLRLRLPNGSVLVAPRRGRNTATMSIPMPGNSAKLHWMECKWGTTAMTKLQAQPNWTHCAQLLVCWSTLQNSAKTTKLDRLQSPK